MANDLSQSPTAPTPRKPTLTSELVASASTIVVDTNVVLDWLVFKNPSSLALADAIKRRQVRWVATAAMRAELADVLQRGLALARGADASAVLSAWDANVNLCVEPPAQPAATALRCTDPDDQKFLDLALATQAHWLLSRDRALLRLARHAALRGTAISVPEAWTFVAWPPAPRWRRTSLRSRNRKGGRSRPLTCLGRARSAG